ncbi:adenosylmethionine decarboxylase [Candidatus Woesearchaeota archaeon]|nr:adenosylmethionine decarboxylase [Candidatus Woesearchaeota archaeon]
MSLTEEKTSDKQTSKRGKFGVKFGFGPHLTLDGYECDSRKLDDMNFLYGLLDTLPGMIGMTKIMPPYILYYDGKDKPEDRGFSGVVIIAESHISIHTYPEKRFLTFDIYSCKSFDIERTVEYVVKAFGIGNFSKRVHHRGREFPKDMDMVENIMDSDRAKTSEQ